MNDTFTLPVRSRPLGVSAGYTTDSYDSNTISGTQLSELNTSSLSYKCRTNDRLSGLRSSSSSSAAARVMIKGSTHKTEVDEAAAFGNLQRLATQSYYHFEIVSISEDLPSNATAPQETMARQTSLKDTAGPVGTYPLTRVKARIQTQFDGPAENRHPDSASPSIKPPQMERRTKRKASVISLRSLTEGVKRSRAGVEKLAHNICHNSCNKVRQACQSIKRQHKEQKKHHSAWKTLRRKLRPGDASKGKHEKESASFSIEKSGHGTECWWKAGVEKYHAPKWMRFGK
ncbi:uncharacterized protein BKA55DRAFT_503747 [Fusarium redolens]|uniref:Uncharacterized protein n=1 Tax=Fusarium redolens TaxID=48865 RepID=A0A9P9HNZ1_FUSRE|nr:uncharacterized protein BKA55DRAFT_503747 [Fusarium redolens]KAH7261363.1 hypothetical protein BKA55DRAFT_503747 [Fusarium redolens]